MIASIEYQQPLCPEMSQLKRAEKVVIFELGAPVHRYYGVQQDYIFLLLCPIIRFPFLFIIILSRNSYPLVGVFIETYLASSCLDKFGGKLLVSLASKVRHL